MKCLRAALCVLLLLGCHALLADDSPEAPFAAMSPAEVRAYERDTLRRVADLALIPPVLNTSPLPQYDYDKLDYGMTIGIERTPKGRLWACWVAGGDSPKAFFVLATSDDDGETWSKPRLVVDSHSTNLPRARSILVGNLWTDPLGRLWLFFDQSMEMFDGRGGVWASVCDDPDAETPVWFAPRRIWHGVMLNKPTVLSNGEWMLPLSLDQRTGEGGHWDENFGPFKGLFPELDPFRGANVFVSTDKGATWQRRAAVKFPNPDWHEHMIVERRDKSLWMLARTVKGIMQSTSTDGGRTWAEPTEPPGIRQPNARFFLRRLASGRLLLVKHGDKVDAHEGRVQLSAWLSDDDSTTWQGGAGARRAQRHFVSRRLSGPGRHDLHLLRPKPRHRWRDPARAVHRGRRAGQEAHRPDIQVEDAHQPASRTPRRHPEVTSCHRLNTTRLSVGKCLQKCHGLD